MRIGSLFSGIGGLEKGLEDAGCGSVVWQVERDPFCRSVLAKHWPHAKRFEDVCAVGLDNLPPVNIICGGFPCQDISYAGKGAGLAGERSGLWREYARIVRELRPRFVVVENVSALLARGLGDVLGDLAALGYDAEWHCVRASDVGAPHRRERLFVVAYALGSKPERSREPGDVAGEARGAQGEGDERQRMRDAAGCGGEARMGHANGPRLEERAGQRRDDGAQFEATERAGCELADARSEGLDHRGIHRGGAAASSGFGKASGPHGDGVGGDAQPRMGRVPHGLSPRLDRWPAGPGEEQHAWEAPRTVGRCDNRAARLKALGNAVVPQVAEVIGGIVMRIALEGRA